MLACALALGACSGPTATDGPVAIQTNPHSGTACLLVNFEGVLVADPTWGLALRGIDTAASPHVYGVVWPNGWTARREGGVIVLVGSGGAVLAREGDTVRVDSPTHDPVTPCGTIQVLASPDHSPGT